MLYDGGFWILREQHCFDKTGMGFISLSSENCTGKTLEILFRREYKNISENALITRLMLERYNDNQIAIYLSTRLQNTTLDLFSRLSSHFRGGITITNVRGPIALNTQLLGDEFDCINVANVFDTIDQIECIKPIYIRNQLLELSKQGETVEY